MDTDLLDLYGRASAWTATKVRGAVTRLDLPSTCEPWTVRTLLNHMLLVQTHFVGAARGDKVELSLSQDPPELLSGDQLIHGWDLAVSTGQDATMAEGLPEAAYTFIEGRWPEEQRRGVLKPAVSSAPDSSAQEKLLAYSGRDPARGR